jgi:thioredoxin 1
MAANLPAFTDDNFESEVKKSPTPVLVDFGAEWCGPCRALAPIVEDLAKEYSGRLKVGTVDIDRAQDVARQFQIMSVPTIIFFKGGSVVDKVTGLRPKADLKKRIDAVLS